MSLVGRLPAYKNSGLPAPQSRQSGWPEAGIPDCQVRCGPVSGFSAAKVGNADGTPRTERQLSAAIPRTSIAVATLVFHIQPIWFILFGVLFMREAGSPSQWIATLIALFGLALTTGLFDEMALATSSGSGYLLGLLMCLGGSLSYAAVTILAKTEKSVSSYALALWQCVVGAGLLVWTPFAFGWPAQPSAWAWLAGLGVLHTGLAYAVIFAGMARLAFGRIAVLQFVYPLSAVLVDWGVYGRTLNPVQLAGVALMALALWSLKRPKGS